MLWPEALDEESCSAGNGLALSLNFRQLGCKY